MSNINMGRVVLGGLVAGLVLNIGEFIMNDVVLGAQLKEFLTRHNFAEPSSNFLIIAVSLTFLMGIVLMFGYACIRPRLGAGPKTAIVAGLFGWFAVYVYSGIVNGVVFGIPPAAIAIGLAFGFVEYALAALAGAWVYQEA